MSASATAVEQLPAFSNCGSATGFCRFQKRVLSVSTIGFAGFSNWFLSVSATGFCRFQKLFFRLQQLVLSVSAIFVVGFAMDIGGGEVGPGIMTSVAHAMQT